MGDWSWLTHPLVVVVMIILALAWWAGSWLQWIHLENVKQRPSAGKAGVDRGKQGAPSGRPASVSGLPGSGSLVTDLKPATQAEVASVLRDGESAQEFCAAALRQEIDRRKASRTRKPTAS